MIFCLNVNVISYIDVESGKFSFDGVRSVKSPDLDDFIDSKKRKVRGYFLC